MLLSVASAQRAGRAGGRLAGWGAGAVTRTVSCRPWEQIPAVSCRGLCADACGPIYASGREKQRLREGWVRLVPRAQALRELQTTGSYRCPALTQDDRCSVYADRPTVCRLGGAQRAMPCPYGCAPDAGLLDDVVGLQLLAQSLQAGGDSGLRGDGPPLTAEAIAGAMGRPEVRAAMDVMLRRPHR